MIKMKCIYTSAILFSVLLQAGCGGSSGTSVIDESPSVGDQNPTDTGGGDNTNPDMGTDTGGEGTNPDSTVVLDGSVEFSRLSESFTIRERSFSGSASESGNDICDYERIEPSEIFQIDYSEFTSDAVLPFLCIGSFDSNTRYHVISYRKAGQTDTLAIVLDIEDKRVLYSQPLGDYNPDGLGSFEKGAVFTNSQGDLVAQLYRSTFDSTETQIKKYSASSLEPTDFSENTPFTLTFVNRISLAFGNTVVFPNIQDNDLWTLDMDDGLYTRVLDLPVGDDYSTTAESASLKSFFVTGERIFQGGPFRRSVYMSSNPESGDDITNAFRSWAFAGEETDPLKEVGFREVDISDDGRILVFTSFEYLPGSDISEAEFNVQNTNDRRMLYYYDIERETGGLISKFVNDGRVELFRDSVEEISIEPIIGDTNNYKINFRVNDKVFNGNPELDTNEFSNDPHGLYVANLTVSSSDE